MTYRLSQQADADLLNLYAESARAFGGAQAERYFERLESTLEFLAVHPLAARERTEYARPVRIYRYQAHVIVYVADGEGILVLRLRHGHDDWARSPLGD